MQLNLYDTCNVLSMFEDSQHNNEFASEHLKYSIVSFISTMHYNSSCSQLETSKVTCVNVYRYVRATEIQEIYEPRGNVAT